MIRPVSSARSAAFAALAGALIAAVCLAGVAPSPAHASSIRWVAATGTATPSGSSCANPNYVGATHLSIQAAIDASGAGDEVMICSGEYAVSSTITVDEDITLTGSGSTLPILDGGNTTRIMSVGTSAVSTVSINRVWFRHGWISDDGNFGAALNPHPNSHVTVSNAYFSQNTAAGEAKGGAIGMVAANGNSAGSLTVTGSSFFENVAFDGGAIVVVGMNGAANTIRNSTFVSNKAVRQGGAIGGSFSNFTASNSTFLDNYNAGNEGGDTAWSVAVSGSLVVYSPTTRVPFQPCGGGGSVAENISTDATCVVSGGSAVAYADLDLGFFAMWGGDMPTVSLGADSVAINAVGSTNCPSSDQRGTSRSDATCDAGAFEYQANPPSVTATPSTVALLKGSQVGVTFSTSGLVSPLSFRVAVEVSEPLPGGVAVNTSTGAISGEAAASYASRSLVVTATDANGLTASGRLEVDNCVPSLDGAGNYVVADLEDLESFRLGACGSDADFLQTEDLTWSGSWESQATVNAPFTGTYDGGGHSITGLQATGTTASFVGFTNGASFRNLSIDVDFDGSYSYYEYSPGGLVGIAFNTSIDNVHLTGAVGSNPATPDAWGCIGGLIGEGEGITVSNSSFTGTVGHSLSSYAGGLIGCPYTVSVIEDSTFDGAVVGADDVGGLSGWIQGTTIRRSFATGTVTAGGVDAGGLVGYDDGGSVLENSYFVGSIAGTQKVGGLIGFSKNSSVSNSYASASITGTSSIGGLIGEIDNSTVTSSFWEAGLAGADDLDPIGSIVGSGEQPAITVTPGDSMKSRAFFDAEGWSIHDGWIAPADSRHTWGICSGVTRPFLSWQYTTDRCAPPSDDSNDPGDGDSGSTPDNDSNTPPSNGSGTPTKNESPASAGDTNSSTTTTTTTVPAPVVEQTTKSSTSVDVGPKVATGKFATMVGDKPVKSTVKWRSGSTIKGMIGVVNVAVVMNPGSVTYNMPGTLTPGSTFKLTLRGLKPGSDIIVNIHSTTRRLGKFTASSAGVIDTEVDIPMDMVAGSHRVEVQAVDKNGERVTMWMGVKVQGTNTRGIDTLPSTGTSSSSPVMLAVLLFCCGWCLVVARRSRVVGFR